MKLKTCLEIVNSVEKGFYQGHNIPSGLEYLVKKEGTDKNRSDWCLEIILPDSFGYSQLLSLSKGLQSFSKNLEIDIDWNEKKIKISAYSSYYDKEIHEKLKPHLDDLELSDVEEEEE